MGATIPSLPSGKVLDRLLKVEVELASTAEGCSYQGYEFGAHYPDSVCIDGFLWDADSGDADPSGEGWVYTNGGEWACPHCNHAAWAEEAIEQLDDTAFDAFHKGVKREECPHPDKSRFEHLGPAFRDAWLQGWDKAAKDEAAHGPR